VTPLRTDPSTAPGPGSADDQARELDRILRADALRTVFQPVVDLATGAPAAVEALVRGPQGSTLASPQQLFAAAAVTGRLAEVEGACLRTALRTAASAGVSPPWTVFVNSSPDLLGLREVPEVPAGAPLHVVVDLTERALTTRPAELLRLVARLRDHGWGIALDDLGADPAALALLPVVRPDVLKLDLRLLAARPEAEVATIVQAVAAQAERDGSTVLAEGVETGADLRTASALGATLAQGWLLGRPAQLGDLLARAAVPARAVAVQRHRTPSAESPFDTVRRRRPVRRVPGEVVEEAVRHLERHALRSVEPSAVVGLGVTSPERVARHEQLARRAGFALVLPGSGELGVAVLGPHFAGVVLARPGSGGGGGLDLVVSHDRDVVVDVVAGLVLLAPEPSPTACPVVRPVVVEVPPAGQQELSARVGEALDDDRRVGTGTGLLVVGVDGGEGSPASRAAVVRRMRRAVRSVDRWIPVAPDLFAVLLTGLPRAGSEGVVERVADALLMAVETSMDSHPDVSVSIGASLAPDRAATGAEAQRQAVAALDAARRAGGHCARIWPV
jgi:EAL domain-containing protein (putative c-di-GMP-specific phosphodiesterase class I)